MPRFLLTAQRAFPIVMVMTLAAALLPSGALGWVKPFAEMTRMVIMPFADVGNGIANWFRPPRTSLDGLPLTTETLRHFQEQMVEYERLYIAEQARADELERQLAQLQNAPPDMPRTPVKMILARIGPRSPSDSQGTVSLNRGSRDGVTIGTVAVHEHVHLVGEVIVTAHMNSLLMPLASKATRALQGAVLAKDRIGAARTLDAAPRLALQGREDGTFLAEPDKSLIINIGDEVVLLDDDWPRPAQGMKIGVVESVRPSDAKPLRNTVIVRPMYHVSEIRMVVLRIDQVETGDGAVP